MHGYHGRTWLNGRLSSEARYSCARLAWLAKQPCMSNQLTSMGNLCNMGNPSLGSRSRHHGVIGQENLVHVISRQQAASSNRLAASGRRQATDSGPVAPVVSRGSRGGLPWSPVACTKIVPKECQHNTKLLLALSWHAVGTTLVRTKIIPT